MTLTLVYIPCLSGPIGLDNEGNPVSYSLAFEDDDAYHSQKRDQYLREYKDIGAITVAQVDELRCISFEGRDRNQDKWEEWGYIPPPVPGPFQPEV